MDNLEKAKWNVGDIHPNGKWVWTEYTPGKFDWRTIKNKVQQPKASAPAEGKEEQPKKDVPPTSTPTVEKPVEKKEESKKEVKKPYDAPKARVTYKMRPESEFDIEFQVPEEWKATNKDGKLVTYERSKYRQTFADNNKMDDAKLLKILNNPQTHPNIRHLLWEEAQARGIPESKVNVSGSLKNEWKINAFKVKTRNGILDEDEDEEDFGTVYNNSLGNFDVDAFRAQFPDGDNGWENKNDPRVRKAFHNLTSLKDRQQWDAVVDLMKREDPYYDGVKEQLATLRVQFMNFLDSDPKKGSAMFVSTGGAGAGKTTALLQVIEKMGMHMFDPTKDSDPTADDIDVVEVTQDIDNEKDFFTLLEKYNGKTIVFDDKDKALVSDANKIKSAMKNIADGNYKSRKLPGNKLFEGKIIFITNKSLDELNSDEDHKAIMSRADKNDIHFTLNENLEVLKSRYKTMGGSLEGFTKQEEDEFLQNVYDTIVNNVDRIDPDKFTVRKFNELLRQVVAIKKAGKMAEENDDFETLFGEKGSNSLQWERQIIKMLNKAEDIDLEKARMSSVISSLTPEQILKYKERYEKDPKGFEKLFGKRLVDFIKDYKNEEALEKAIMNELTSMSIEEAENLLFG